RNSSASILALWKGPLPSLPARFSLARSSLMKTWEQKPCAAWLSRTCQSLWSTTQEGGTFTRRVGNHIAGLIRVPRGTISRHERRLGSRAATRSAPALCPANRDLIELTHQRQLGRIAGLTIESSGQFP